MGRASRSLLAFTAVAAAATRYAGAQQAGTFQQVGNSRVSAMMMFLGNEEKVYIMDKVEGNAEQINGHPAWASVWDIASKKADLLDFNSNAFCAAGSSAPNGSFVTFGGNGAVSPGGNLGSDAYPGGYRAAYDATYKDADGTKSIRVLNPCTGDASSWGQECQFYDNAAVLAMQKSRWYAGAEALADGSVVLLGGFANGGYINRNYPNTDCGEGGAAENTFEFWPSRGDAQYSNFMCKTSGLNSYAHMYLMPSGKMFVNANFSSMLWDYNSNTETDLPDTPNKLVWVYPSSGAAAMLPLTPQNGYTPTLLFCGGQDGTSMPDDLWGDYKWPVGNTFDIPAKQNCYRITPEPMDGSTPAYTADDNMIQGRTMGEFVTLPTGQLLVINGGANGTAGYATQTGQTPESKMQFGMSLASDPVLTPALYDPSKPAGQRWSNQGFAASQIPRLYHSTSLLLPDGSVMVAGSNPNVDVNLTAPYPTEYRVEYFYPPYFNASVRPSPSGIPKTISYGGAGFNLTIPASGYSGSANDAAGSAKVMLIRPGWTTHAMHMGQRALQLNSTYAVQDNGDIVLYTSQAPPNPNLLTPGPVLLFVVVNGVPSVGKQVIVGNGQLGTQPTADVVALPASVQNGNAQGSATGSNPSATNGGSDSTSPTGKSGASYLAPSMLTVVFTVAALVITA